MENTESGRLEVYVQSFPEHGGKWQISATGSNLANKLYYNSVFDLRSVGAGADFALIAPPREYSIQVEHRF